VIQNSDMLKLLKGNGDNLQIVHVTLGKTNHWVIISILLVVLRMKLNCMICYCKNHASLDMQTVIARYLRSLSQSLRIKVINVALQKGSTDCGLYAIAMMTSTAYISKIQHMLFMIISN